MNLSLLTSVPFAAIELIYLASVHGLAFHNLIVIGDGGTRYQVLRDYVAMRNVYLHFVRDANCPECFDLARELSPDVLVVVTGSILRRPLLGIPSVGTVNTHAGILPQYRGVDSPLWAILEGGRIGVTSYFIDEGIDTGNIIAERELRLAPGDTVESVVARNHHQNKWQTATEAVLQIEAGTTNPTPQRRDDGRQYFRMHPKLVQLVRDVLKKRE
jgi:methionyl-tRNA formyltransferase